MTPSEPDVGRYRRYLDREFDNVVLYRRLAEGSEGEHREVLQELAAAEERHARYWQDKLVELGVTAGEVGQHRPSALTRLLSLLARRLGVRRIVPLLERVEAAERGRYGDEPDVGAGMAADEMIHAQMVASLAPAWRARASGSLRAGVFGMNDGLVSNLALVMGMTGGSASGDTVLLAGLAGLVAGAGSMAAGEYISVKSQLELLEGDRPPSPEELRAIAAEGSVAQLELLLRLRGLDAGEASDIATQGDHQAAAAAFDRAQPDLAGLGSPMGAAGSSFVAFASGAAIPVIPFLFGSGPWALITASALAGLALFVVGALISLLTNRSMVRSGMRQLGIGAVTALGTYVVGLTVGAIVG